MRKKKNKKPVARKDTSSKARKVAKQKVVKKATLPKTRNHARWTESQFWSFIRSALRQKSRWWIPILEAKRKVKRPYKGANKRQKFEYQCNHCKEWFADKNCQVDHIEPAGTLKSAADLAAFVENLFCEIDGLQIGRASCRERVSSPV